MSTYSHEIGTDASWPVEATRRMNRMYRRQRHIYDGTRRYYLLGRDRLIADLAPAAGANVLEIGCGTGSNLVHGRPALSGYAVFRHRYFDGDADVGDISHFAPRSSEANSRRTWRRNRLQSAALVRDRRRSTM